MFNRHRSALLALVLTGVLALGGGQFNPAAADASPGANGVPLNAYELDLLNRTNDARGAAGLPGLAAQNGSTDVARRWAGVLAQQAALSHNPDLGPELDRSGSLGWRVAAENVGQGGSSPAVFQAYMNSSAHRANILRANVTTIGIGSARSSDGRVWDVMVFVDTYASSYGGPRTSPEPTATSGAGAAPSPTPAPPAGRFIQARGDASPGGAAYAFEFGSANSTTLACDVNGDGKDDIVAYQDGYWSIRFSPSGGAPDLAFAYGFPGATPVCGDWNGTGRDGIGVYANGTWYLRQTASPGAPDAGRFDYGWPGAKAVTGDWNGTGRDGIGIYDVNGYSFWIRDTANAGAAASVYAYGWSDATPVTGDWNGDGRTDTGVYSNGMWYLRDSATPGPTNRQFSYGGPGGRPVVGDWNGDRRDGIAVSWGP